MSDPVTRLNAALALAGGTGGRNRLRTSGSSRSRAWTDMIRRAAVAAALSGLPIFLGCSAGEEEPVADTVSPSSVVPPRPSQSFERVALSGCDMDLAANPANMAAQVVAVINIWETANGGPIVGQARGIDQSERIGTPGWCVGELISVLQRQVDDSGRRRVQIRTRSGLEGWVTEFFLLE